MYTQGQEAWEEWRKPRAMSVYVLEGMKCHYHVASLHSNHYPVLEKLQVAGYGVPLELEEQRHLTVPDI
jgi:hypothetical protein